MCITVLMPWWHWQMVNIVSVASQLCLSLLSSMGLVTTAGDIARDRFPWVAVAALSALSAHTAELHTLQSVAVSMHIPRFAAGSGT